MNCDPFHGHKVSEASQNHMIDDIHVILADKRRVGMKTYGILTVYNKRKINR